MPSSLFRAVSLAIALLAATAGTPFAETLRLLSETPSGLDLAWTPGASTRVERLALPPGTRAVLATGADAGARLEDGGWYRHTRFVRLVLEPGPGPERRIRVDFVADPSPPVVETPAPDGAPPAEAPRTVGGSGSGRLFFNEGTAERVERQLRDSPELRPRLPQRGPAGSPLRRLGTVVDNAESVPEAGRWTGRDPASPRVEGFETGRLLIEIGLPGAATIDRGDGVQRVLDPDGIYRLSWRQLADAGHLIDGVSSDELRLTRWRTGLTPDEVAISVLDRNGNGLFDDGDAFDFWGEAQRGESCATCFQRADYTDVSAYVLDSASGARARMASPRPPVGALPDSADHARTLRFEVGNRFIGRLGVGLAAIDHFYWCPALTWTGGPEVTRTETLELPGLRRASSRPAAARVHLLARTTTDHHSQVEVNGLLVSDIESTGAILELHEAMLAASDLRPDTDVTVRLPGPATAANDQFELDWFEIDYPSDYLAENDRHSFAHEGGESVTVTGFSSNADFTVLDVTDPMQPVPIEAQAVGLDGVGFEAESAGRYAVAVHPGGEGAIAPLALTWLPATNLADPANDFDVVVIGPREWLFETGGALRPAVQAWADLRESQGLSVLPVAVEDVVSEFSGGLWTPSGLFYFIQRAIVDWAGPPQHVLLVGDTTIDYKGQLEGRVLLPSDCSDLGVGPCGFNEPGWIRGVQTVVIDDPGDTEFVGHYAADARLATVIGGDSVPDVALGRLPVRSAAELDVLLDKIRAYDQLVDAPPPWASRVHFVGDAIDPAEPGEDRIEESQERARLEHVLPPYAAQTFYYQSDYGGVDPELLTADLLAAWQSPGAAVVSYVGHGNALNWSSDALLTNNGAGCRNDAADDLSDPATPLPVVLNVGCITGAFMREVGPALLEELVRSPGGAIAAYGPTGLTDLSQASTIVDGFIGGIHGRTGRGRLLGDIALRLQARLAIAGLGDAALANAVLGDPTLRLVVPHGPAADGVTIEASPGDGLVSLSWPAVAGADSYQVYRREVGSPDAPTPVGVTADTLLDDSGVINGTLYEYWLEAFAGAWPGRWSDPGVQARPCTTVPPEPPSNLALSRVFDRIVRLSWDASPTVGIAGYRVRIFAGSEAVGEPLTVRDSSATSLTHGPLDPCREYTFQVRTLGWCDLESLGATELTARAPDCSLVADPPRTVRDLRVRRVGSDLVLDWSPVTQTLQGAPFTLVHYQVHRSELADFLASPATLQGTAPFPSQAIGGAGAPGGAALEFFSVAAEADTGLTGGIGRDFPLGVDDLVVTDAGTDWSLTWSPVTADLEGARTALLSYQVHASATPLDASSAGPATLVQTLGPAEVSALVPKTDGDFHLVLAEDVHGNLSPF